MLLRYAVLKNSRSHVSPQVLKRHVLLWVALAWAALALGCSAGPVQQSPPQSPSTPRAPTSGDLRFQQVDAPSEANQCSGPGASSDIFGNTTQSWPDAVGSPLELLFQVCVPGVPGDCAWDYWVTALPSGQSGLTAYYWGGSYSNLDSDLTTVSTPNTVITSFDLEPASGWYGAAAMQTSQGGGFDLKQEDVPPAQIQSTVTQDGALSRVVTAVSFDASGQAYLLSYGWQSATTTTYQASVLNVAADGVANAATSLAASGYIITAFGGNPTNGYVLIGTKVQGDTTPRPILVGTQVGFPAGCAGYAPVGWVDYVTSDNTVAYAQIFEK